MSKADAQVLDDLLTRRGQFGHREYLELAWTYLASHPVTEAERAMSAAIREVAARHGAPDKYHETMTRAWVRLVAAHRHGSESSGFEVFMAANPGLLDRRLLAGHYSDDLLWSDAARGGCVEPDLRALPASA
jgi:hypothetical protein